MRAFYKLTVKLVYGMAYRVISNTHEAEEVALEVFMQVWRNASNYNSELSEPLTWLLMITKRRAIDRKRNISKKMLADETLDENLASTEDSAELIYIAGQKREIVRNALDQLPHKQRRVIELSFYYQMSHGEIAEHMDMPLGSVKSTIRVAMVKLRNIIKKIERKYDHGSKIH
ncbi:MAG: sigma-70 family RNA polymerase sigma factor [Thermodesulfobacteriota bacterium]